MPAGLNLVASARVVGEIPDSGQVIVLQKAHALTRYGENLINIVIAPVLHCSLGLATAFVSRRAVRRGTSWFINYLFTNESP